MACALIFMLHIYALFFTDSEYEHASEEEFEESSASEGHAAPISKRVRTEDSAPSGSRASSRQGGKEFVQRGGKTVSVRRKRGGSEDSRTRKINGELLPVKSTKDMSRAEWSDLRKQNPYRFPKRTQSADSRFWTNTQALQWEEVYDAYKMAKHAKILAFNVDWHNMYVEDDFKFVDEALKKMDVFDLVCLKEDFFPDYVRQFFCTVYFHDDDERTMTWMTGSRKFTGNFADFVDALGYSNRTDRGFRIHSESPKPADSLAFCYPPDSEFAPPCMSGMYFYYHTMARIFRETLVSKMGDLTNCRGHHANLVYYSAPNHWRKIDGCDYIYCELRKAVLGRMTPNYCVMVQKFLNKMVPGGLMTGTRVIQDSLACSRRGDYIEVPNMMPGYHSRFRPATRTPASSSRRGGSSSSRVPRSGVAKFFKSLWEMCRSNYDVNHAALQLAQENRRRHNDFLTSHNVTPPPDGPGMAPVPYINYEMPPLDDAMFYGFDVPGQFSQFAPGASSSAPPGGDGGSGAPGDDGGNPSFEPNFF